MFSERARDSIAPMESPSLNSSRLNSSTARAPQRRSGFTVKPPKPGIGVSYGVARTSRVSTHWLVQPTALVHEGSHLTSELHAEAIARSCDLPWVSTAEPRV